MQKLKLLVCQLSKRELYNNEWLAARRAEGSNEKHFMKSSSIFIHKTKLVEKACQPYLGILSIFLGERERHARLRNASHMRRRGVMNGVNRNAAVSAAGILHRRIRRVDLLQTLLFAFGFGLDQTGAESFVEAEEDGGVNTVGDCSRANAGEERSDATDARRRVLPNAHNGATEAGSR